MATRALRGLPTLLVGLLTVAVLFTAFTATQAWSQGQPADKVAATGSDVDEATDDTVILSEQMRVSSPADLILSVTAECTILTELTTGPDTAAGASDSAFAFGSVRLRVLIDGKEVPVAVDENSGPNEGGDGDADADGNEIGEVTFCNRAYQRTVSDGENAQDGIDEEHDFIRTRTANAFNWIALDVGTAYDDIANGQNILDIQVLADFDTDTAGDAVAEALVGSRTLTIEPGHFHNTETVGGPDTK